MPEQGSDVAKTIGLAALRLVQNGEVKTDGREGRTGIQKRGDRVGPGQGGGDGEEGAPSSRTPPVIGD